MHKLKKGFTIVELLVVTVVIVILATILTLAYLGYQKQAAAKQGESMARLVASGAEKYFATNNEYPSVNQLASNGDGKAISNFTTVSTYLASPADIFQNTNWTFTPCAASATTYCTIASTDTNRVFYFSKTTSSVATVTFTFPSPWSCSIQFPSAETGSTAFAVAYANPTNISNLVLLKSSNGTVTISSGTCSF